ncbi:MAG: ice-binding family protein [Bacteroidota bacterium]
MKNTLLSIVAAVTLLVFPQIGFAQAPDLGDAADFVLFSSNGAVTNSSPSRLTGDVGTNNGGLTGFGNVNGRMQNGNGATAAAASDLLTAYNDLNGRTPDFFPASVLGGGQILTPGVYSISGAASLNGTLTLNAQGNSSAIFIIKIQGSFSSSAASQVVLINGAQACNVFWKTEGLTELATNTVFKGTIVANNAAITLNTGVKLEGRALSTTGAVSVGGITAGIPTGCGSPTLTGPTAPSLGNVACFSIFSGSGSVSNSGVTTVTGDIGSNVGLTTGYNPLLVNGTIHTVPDATTSAAASSLTGVYNYLNTLAYDIELLYPAQFGNSLVLTPHTYLLNAATSLTDTIFLNAEGNANAVFVLKINGALSTSTGSNVILTNGAQAKNVYWKVDGAANISSGSNFKGTLIVNNGALSLATGVMLIGRAFTTSGQLTTASVNVTMTAGCGTSSSAPAIITQPSNQTACAGGSASFTVSATGDNLTYQWRKGIVNISNGGNISGATSATLTINPVNTADAATTYNVVVSGSTSPSATSNNASLTVNTAPAITSQPTNQTTCSGSTATFSVTATGTLLTYQWRKGTTNLVNGGNISGATTSTLTINPASASDVASNYNVVVFGSCLPNATSNNVSLTVSTAPVITSQPTGQTVCAGSPVSFSTTATGANLTYQWRKGTVNIANGGTVSGATTNMLTISSASVSDAASNYNVVVSGTCTPGATSQDAALTVNTAPSISSQPTSQTVCVGSPISFSTTATGTALTYQWRNGTVNMTNSANVTGATSATLTINNVNVSDGSTTYNVVVSGTCSPAVTSANASLTVNTAPAIASQPSNQAVCLGTPATFTTTATGTALTYQWRNGTVNLINGGRISGANSAMLTLNAVTASDASSNYNVVVSGTCAPAITSANVSLTINTAPNITSEPTDKTVCAGAGTSFTTTATGTALTYQWRRGSVNIANGGNISGANSPTLTFSSVTVANDAADYNVIVSGTCSPNDTSRNVTLTVNTSPVITSESANQTICTGNTAVFSVTATGSGLTYQWRRGTVNLLEGGNISGTNTNTLVIDQADASYAGSNYNVLITGTCSPNATSRNMSLVVSAAPAITLDAPTQSVGAGNSVTLSVTASGTGLTYQWRRGTVNLTNGGNISGATTNTLTINPATAADASAEYNVVVRGSCPGGAVTETTSQNITLVVTTAPTFTSQPSNQTVCAGATSTFSVVANGTGLTYQWRKGTVDLTNTGNISGATTATLTINPVNATDAAANYNVVVTNSSAQSTTSSFASLVVNTAPAITSQPTSTSVKEGSSASFTVTATGTSLSYQWRKGTVNLTDGGNISGANTATLTINPVTAADAANYSVVVSGTCSPSVTSSANTSLTLSGPSAIGDEGNTGNVVSFYPNPWSTSTVVTVSNASELNSSVLKIYNALGEVVLNVTLTKTTTTLNTELPSGVYFYQVIGSNGTIQSGKVISQQ